MLNIKKMDISILFFMIIARGKIAYAQPAVYVIMHGAWEVPSNLKTATF